MAVTRQFGLLKEGYSKARDNLRAEQSVRRAASVDPAAREVSLRRSGISRLRCTKYNFVVLADTTTCIVVAGLLKWPRYLFSPFPQSFFIPWGT